MSASRNFARLCWVTVFPVPNPPGIAAVPPFARGNMVSRMRMPVTRGTVGSSLFSVGRGILTGQ